MTKVAPFLLVLMLSACSEPPRETVFTVSEFLADDGLRAEHIEHCRENPGELAETPNCRNAEEADGKARLDRMNRALGG